jgi:hypothetical protein
MWKRLVVNPVFTHLGVLVLALGAAIIYIRLSKPSGPIYVPVPGATQYVPVPKKVREIATITVPGPERVALVPSAIVSEKLKWPEIGKDNILTVGEVPPYRGKTSVAAVADFNDNTMTTRLVMRQEKMPFIGWEREWHGGIWYGLAGRNKVQGEIEFLPLRIGPVFPSIKGTVGMEEGGNVNGQILVGVRF